MKLLLFKTNIDNLSDQKKVIKNFHTEEKVIKCTFQQHENFTMMFVYGTPKLSVREVMEIMEDFEYHCQYFKQYNSDAITHETAAL